MSPQTHRLLRTKFRESHDGVSPIIGVLLMVTITLVLTSVTYVMLSNIYSGTRAPPILVTLYRDSGSNGTQSSVRVAGVSEDGQHLSLFEALLRRDGVAEPGSRISPLAPGTNGNLTLDSLDAYLGAGDTFGVMTTPGIRYEILIVALASGSTVGSFQWTP